MTDEKKPPQEVAEFTKDGLPKVLMTDADYPNHGAKLQAIKTLMRVKGSLAGAQSGLKKALFDLKTMLPDSAMVDQVEAAIGQIDKLLELDQFKAESERIMAAGQLWRCPAAAKGLDSA